MRPISLYSLGAIVTFGLTAARLYPRLYWCHYNGIKSDDNECSLDNKCPEIYINIIASGSALVVANSCAFINALIWPLTIPHELYLICSSKSESSDNHSKNKSNESKINESSSGSGNSSPRVRSVSAEERQEERDE
jgi:hypothetical protein